MSVEEIWEVLTESGNGVSWLFCISMAFLTASVAIVGCKLPSLLKLGGSFHEERTSFGLMQAFSSGVMLAVGLVHLLAEAGEDLDDRGYPTAQAMCGVGFILTLILESGIQHNHVMDSSQEYLLGNEGRRGRPSSFSGREQSGKVSMANAIVMTVALSFHSVLEGMAIGAQQTTISALGVVFGVVLHKGLVGFVLSSTLLSSEVLQPGFQEAVFISASPLGILMGKGLVDFLGTQYANGGVGTSVISALASGTFLYVTFMEMFPSVLSTTSGKQGFRGHLGKITLVVVGYSLMCMVAVWS